MILDIPKVVKEWSYLVNDGMPDPTNTAHLIKLGQLLIEMKYDPVFVYEYISSLEEAIPDNVLKKKIKNPKTGRQILVSTGLGYKGGKTPSQKAGYGAAKQYLDDEGYDEEDIKSAEEKGTEPEDDTQPQKEPTGKNALKLKANLDKIDGPDVVASNGKTRRENAEEVMRLVDNYESAETDDEKRAALKAMADSKLFAKTAPGLPKTKKFYIGEKDATQRKMTKDKEHPKGYGRIDPTTGLSYDLIGGKNAKAFAFKINADLDRLGNPGIKMVGELTGRKRMAGDNLLRGQAGRPEKDDAPVEKVSVTKTDTGVIIGKSDEKGNEHEGYVLDYITETLSDKELRAVGLSDKDIKEYKGQVDLHNRRVRKFAESDNFEAFQILDPESGEPLNPATIEGRRKSVSAIVSLVKSRYEKLLGEKLSPAMESALENLKKEADDYASGKTRQGKKFRKALNEFFATVVDDEAGRPSASDIAETHALLTDLSMGRYAVLPSKSNFAVSDVISASMRAKLDKDSSAEDIRNAVKIIITTAKGPTSIKFEKGGPSQSNNKILDTEYGSTTNVLTGEEIKGEEVKGDLKELSDPIYEGLYTFVTKSIDNAKSKTDNIAKKYGIKDYPEEGEEYDKNKHIYERKEIYDERIKVPGGKYHKRAKTWMKNLKDCPSMDKNIPKQDKDGNDLSEEQRLELAHRRLVEVYEQVDKAGGVMQRVNNNQMKTQLFTNRILKANINRKTKKRETEIIETNGLSTLAGMNFVDDPGFDKGCAKPSNKMPSRITTVKKG